MNKRAIAFCICFTFTISVLFSLSCAKKAEQPAMKYEEATTEQPLEEAAPAPESEKSMIAGKKDLAKRREGRDVDDRDEEGLYGNFFIPMDLAFERLLEYDVNLLYECDDVLAARQELLKLTGKYGFYKSSASSAGDDAPRVSALLFVKSDRLYNALQEFEKLGILLDETISVTDHTEDMVKSQRQIKREQIRMARRNRAARQIGAGAKNWQDVENSITESENRLDASEHEKWSIRDKVSWAKVSIHLKGPDTVYVPKYRNTLVGVVNALLQFVNALIYLAIPIGIAILIIWKRKSIKRIFTRKKV